MAQGAVNQVARMTFEMFFDINRTIAQFLYFNIQPKTIDITTRLRE